MNDINVVKQKIEDLRKELNKLSLPHTSNKALRLSQELDFYIVAFQKAFYQKNRN
ncbi:aspartyl-phosphate phosphatase Spo0E family protein [Desulfoscipio geothermicus]|uniref:Spo0E like sporulation regulatory protein n=1 Tax=Desulfoscipio geothermicus DSM 3669 TaxID=1121426 RepID=A0A1I6DNW2_9FIRM|nr:aspartyl-phosphate phosphatase Spo0E family protein [Desulfoscipio geothermicus]SFR07140.1 Spo0E like sporulation regulatory protein [Desulfoscipio geothermicus DSM 3669]